MTGIALIDRAFDHASRDAIVCGGDTFSYAELLRDSESIAAAILDGRDDLEQARITFLAPSSYDYVRTLWGIWRAGGIAVPLCTSHPRPELEYVLQDTRAEQLIAHRDFDAIARPLAKDIGLDYSALEELETDKPAALPDIDPSRAATILYTSGTTGKPKGVVATHANITAQIEMLIDAWGWVEDDRIVQFLPLHHVHGIINVLSCSLWAGARCEMLPAFEAATVWGRLADEEAALTVFMAVPTVYAKLAAARDAAAPETQLEWLNACQKLRLMVSGSAALPVKMLQRWETISGHRLLERYGMTEIGMALSNPLNGERVAGHVGSPLPGVSVRLVDESNEPVGVQGEIQVKSASVFPEYWERPDATRDAFTADGWFKTGDIAIETNGIFRILGRSSVDIIKTGGYKVSALEIEEVLRTHEAICDCAVVGVPDDEWGEVISVAIIRADSQHLDLDQLRAWCKERLAAYKTPRRFQLVEDLPRNAMGKVTKKAVTKLFT
ncbi:MAG: malonyl-CoA/methylmalonyl-CoA synthetase [Verrucomicrobiales bacterium]|jgi:malonyl-CoA/methylmalonyl-CoA synthetase